MLYQIFDVSAEKAKETFEELQNYKKLFKELEKDSDKFYNSVEYTDQLKLYREDHIQPRMPVQIDQVIHGLSSAKCVDLSKERTEIFKYSRSRYFL